MKHARYHQHIVDRHHLVDWLSKAERRSGVTLEKDVVKMAGLSARRITAQRLAEAFGKLRKQLQVKVKLNEHQEVVLAMWVAVGIVVLIERRQDTAVRQLMIDALTCPQDILMERCQRAYAARDKQLDVIVPVTARVIHDPGDDVGEVIG